jgi:uncharacterized protein involved in tolerance to divalent cations
MNTYYEVKISAENKTEAIKILDSLLNKRLVTGGQLIVTPARFLWKGEIVDQPEYVTIMSFTTEERKTAMLEDIRLNSREEVPMIVFTTPQHLNAELCDWIDETLSEKTNP